MLTYERIGDDTRPPIWRSVLYLVVAGFLAMFALVYSPAAWEQEQNETGLALLTLMLGLVLIILLCVALFWRHRFPFLFALVPAAISLLIPIGNIFPLLATATLIGRRRGPAVWLTTGIVVVTSTWVTWRDSLAQPQAASFWKSILGPNDPAGTQPMDLSTSTVVLIILFSIGSTIGFGMLMRSRREATDAEQEVARERQTVDRLGDEVARQAERERIAREVHDALGHRLSLLNLHAGALEMQAEDNPEIVESARLIRTSAAAAVSDLQALLALLRQPADSQQPAVPLSQLATVVQESFGAGQQLNSAIFIQDPDSAAPELTRAVYRIVQELLTNARKHAPNQPVSLRVDGSPEAGITIETQNRFAPAASTSDRGLGLPGIVERAELLGGTARYGRDGQVFRVQVLLPWRSPAAAENQG